MLVLNLMIIYCQKQFFGGSKTTQLRKMIWFLIECGKSFGFAKTKLAARLARLCHPNRIEIKNILDSLAHVFPPLASATCN